MEPWKPADKPDAEDQPNLDNSQAGRQPDSTLNPPVQPPADSLTSSGTPVYKDSNENISSDNSQPANSSAPFNNTGPFRPQTVVGNFEPSMPTPKNSKKKKLLIASGLVAVTLLAAAGFVFGYYVPNQPDNVYRTGLERSGEAIHKMLVQSTETEKLEQIKKSEFDGLLEITSDFGNINGSFNAKVDPTKTDSKLDIAFKEKDKPEQKYALKMLTQLKDGKRFPDTYFQLSGLKYFSDFSPEIAEYDGKWVAVEAEYLESLGAGFLPPEEKTNKENISAEEVAELIRIISDTNNEYLFTTDPSKAVLENRGYLNKEKTAEGINAFHYKVGVNPDNAVNYCKVLSDRALSTRAAKKFMDADDKAMEEQKKSASKDCEDSKKEIKPEETFEMWVDAKYKVIHKIRIYEEQNKTDRYTDIGQIYTGGDKLSFFMLYHSDENNLNVKFTLDVDIKSTNSKAEVTASQEGSSGFNGRGSISAKPFAGEINVKKPDGAVSISEILKKFGYDPSGISGIQGRAKDAERKSDINAVYANLEVFYADNGFYPTVQQLNDKSFRASQMSNPDESAFTPPDSTNSKFLATPSKAQYGYTPSQCGSGKCQAYTLSALLEDGSVYKKVNVN